MKCLFCNNQLTGVYCTLCDIHIFDNVLVFDRKINVDRSEYKYFAQYFFGSKKLFIYLNNHLINVIANPNLKEINRFISKFIKMQYLR